VEYPAGQPDNARIQGMRYAPVSAWALFIVIFPLIGAVFAARRWMLGGRAVYLMREGYLGLAELKSKKTTGGRINKRTVYKMAFAFEANDGQTYACTTRTHEPERLEDKAAEHVLYDPRDPRRAMMLDTLPGKPTTDDLGRIVPVVGRAAYSLIIPIATVLGHGAYVCVAFFL
jgi:hypothetical protein